MYQKYPIIKGIAGGLNTRLWGFLSVNDSNENLYRFVLINYFASLSAESIVLTLHYSEFILLTGMDTHTSGPSKGGTRGIK